MQYKEQSCKYVKFTRPKAIACHDFGTLKRKQMHANARTTQQPLRTPTSRNNPRDMQQHSFNESF
jgi:hypothetical protein